MYQVPSQTTLRDLTSGSRKIGRTVLVAGFSMKALSFEHNVLGGESRLFTSDSRI